MQAERRIEMQRIRFWNPTSGETFCHLLNCRIFSCRLVDKGMQSILVYVSKRTK